MTAATSGIFDGLPLGPLASDIGVVGLVVFFMLLVITGRIVPKRELDRVTAEADARVARERELADARVAREKELADAWQSAWGAERIVSAEALSQRDELADEYARTAKHVLDSLPRLATDDDPRGGTP